ncbi:MAG: type II toxin-antitoxin system death-on-curing family toxin [Nitrospinae bacterium]|nr:type II toxin-antitoxin system death-on-curing family toxin [Nitrospinota bacterium]
MKIRWVGKRAVLAIHTQMIAEYGGSEGVREDGLLESALARPLNLHGYDNPPVFDLAAAYAFGIVRNHPFIDGNKRTGLVVAGVFLFLNGWDLAASEADAVTMFFRLAEGKITEKELAAWFKGNCVRIKK